MNKLKLYITALLISASMLNIGCMSTVGNHVSSAYSNVKRELTKPGTKAQDELYQQVSDSDKAQVQQLQHELEVTEQKRVLARLERDRDNLQHQRSEQNDKRMQLLAEEKLYRVQLARLEAIDRNQLGDKITNIESITDVHVDAIETQQKRLKYESKVSILDVRLEQVNQEIQTQTTKLEQLTNNS